MRHHTTAEAKQRRRVIRCVLPIDLDPSHRLFGGVITSEALHETRRRLEDKYTGWVEK